MGLKPPTAGTWSSTVSVILRGVSSKAELAGLAVAWCGKRADRTIKCMRMRYEICEKQEESAKRLMASLAQAVRIEQLSN